MKIKCTAIGFSDVSKIRTFERMIKIGSAAGCVGGLIAAVGLIGIERSQEWFDAGVNEHVLAYVKNIRTNLDDIYK